MNIEFAQIVTMPTRDIVNNNGQIADVPANPRNIKKAKFESLKERITQNNLLGVFPLKVFLNNGKYVVLGGNQRLRAAKELKFANVPCIIIPEDADAATLREIVILENTHDGDNDWDKLANEWDASELANWGVDAANWGKEPEPEEEQTGKHEKKSGIFVHCERGETWHVAGRILKAGDEIELADIILYDQK